MKKILYILNVAKKLSHFSESSMIAAKNIGYEFHIACNYSYANNQERIEDENKFNIKIHQVDFERNPLSIKNIKAYKQLNKLFQLYDYEIVHCNTPIGGVLGRICAKKNKIKHIIYQAHGFHFYKDAPKKNWLFYYPVEKILSKYTDLLITINEEDYELADNRFYSKEIKYVPGIGIDLDKYNPLIEKKLKIRDSWNIKEKLVLFSVNSSFQASDYENIVNLMNDKIGKDHYILYIYNDKSDLNALQDFKAITKDKTIAILENIDDKKKLWAIADIYICKRDNDDMCYKAYANKIACVIYDDVKRSNDRLTKLALDKEYRKSICLQKYQTFVYSYDTENFDTNNTTSGIKKLHELKLSLGLKVDDFILLSVGEINKNKNHEVIIRELPKVDSNVHYLILGEGHLKTNLLKLAKEINVDTRVHFLGYSDHIIDYYKLANIFIHPSLREGLPMALLEAMACGCQCFASNIRGCRNVLDEIFLFNPHNVNLKKILELTYQYNDNESKVIPYSMKNIIEMMEQIYLSIQ